jgi:RHS repeat-associated protein
MYISTISAMEQGKLRMLRFMSSRLMVMLLGSVFCAQPLLFAGAAPDQQAYVVTVRPDASIDGIPVIARQMAASYGGTVVEGAGGGGDTFVIRVPQSRARMLAVDPHVKSVVPMGLTPAPQTAVETVPWSSGVAYSYDGTGNITQIGNDAFAYDGVSRLSQATVNGIARKYDYDAFGNRTACTQFGPNDCQGLLINATENRNRIAGAGYDAAGNVTGLSGHVYSYDPLNMMTRDSFGQLSREFVYTADDERIATYAVGSSWNWTIRGTDGKVLREFTSNDGPAGPGTTSWQWTKDDIWRNGLLLASRQPDGANTTTYHYHLDHLGTPRRVTDQNDRIVGVHDYLAFGPELSGATAEPSATALRYTGHERDNWSSGSSDALDYMHARYYSPWMGRFLSVDRHLGHPGSPQSWNRYSYALDNPIRMLDLDGNAPRDSRVIHVVVNVVYSNADRTAPPYVTRSVRERTETGLVQARQHFAQMGIALTVRRSEGEIHLDHKGNVSGNVITPSGPVALQDFIKSNVASGSLTLMATPNIDLGNYATSGTKIQNGVPLWTLLGSESGPKDAEHEMAHSFGNTIGDNKSEAANAATDFAWFADRTQDDLGLGFTDWFVDVLREGAAKLEDKGH